MNPDLETEEQEYERLGETGFMLLLTPLELTYLQLILNRYVPLDRSQSVESIRAKVNELVESA